VVYNRSNVSIFNCTIVDFLSQGVRITGSGNCTGNSFHDNIVTNCGGSDSDEHANLSLSYNTGILIYGNTIVQDKRQSGGTGLGIQVEDNFYGGRIYNNNIRGTESGSSGNGTFAIELWCGSKSMGHGMEIYGNTIIGEVDFGAGVTKGSYTYGVDFHNNIIGYEVSDIPSDLNIGRTALQFEEVVSDVIVRNNLFKNVNRQIYFCSNGTAGSFENISINNNIFQNVFYSYLCQSTVAGYSAHGVGIIFGGSPYSYARNIYIRNNDFIAYAGRPAETAIFLPTNGDCDNVYVQNNIIQGFSVAPMSAEAQNGGGSLTTLVLQKNLLFNNGNNNTLKTVGFTPTSVTNDGGITGNPLFISATDYHLQAGSPACGAGLSISGLTTDYEGKALKSPPSIGAYESASSAPLPVVPVYQSSVVQNATPSLLEMTYNTTLANIVPAAASFTVLVNTVPNAVNTVAIAGVKVQLTLSGAIKAGDIVTVGYTKPAINPLQSSTAGQAVNISGQPVINNLIIPTKDAATVTVSMTLSPLHIHKVVNIMLVYSASMASASASITPEIIRISDLSGKLYIEKAIVTGATNIKIPLNLRSGIYTVQLTGNGLTLASQKMVIY